MSEQTEIEAAKVRLRGNGELTILDDGKPLVIAKYDRKSGVLEFATKGDSVKFYNQVVARISTVAGGTEPSGNVIRAIRVKGDDSTVAKNAPKRPKMGPLGDSAADIVEWYLAYDLPQAIVRYGIYCDDRGEPIRKRVRRKVVNIVDNRDLADEDLTPNKQGKTQEKGPVGMEGEIVEEASGIIARRATARTYTPNEVVGGYQPDDDFEEPAGADDEEGDQ